MTQDQIKVMRFQSGLTRDDLRDAVYRAVPELTRDKAKKILDEVFEEIIDSFLIVLSKAIAILEISPPAIRASSIIIFTYFEAIYIF